MIKDLFKGIKEIWRIIILTIKKWSSTSMFEKQMKNVVYVMNEYLYIKIIYI